MVNKFLLNLNDSLGIVLHKLKENCDSDTVMPMHTAIMRRQEQKNLASVVYSIQSVSKTLYLQFLFYIVMLLEWSGNFEVSDNQAALLISQLIVFNAVKRPRRTTASKAGQKSLSIRHALNKKIPLAIYVGMML
jgi:hypothetical protein